MNAFVVVHTPGGDVTLTMLFTELHNGLINFHAQAICYPGQPPIDIPVGTYHVDLYGDDGQHCAGWDMPIPGRIRVGSDDGADYLTVVIPLKITTGEPHVGPHPEPVHRTH